MITHRVACLAMSTLILAGACEDDPERITPKDPALDAAIDPGDAGVQDADVRPPIDAAIDLGDAGVQDADVRPGVDCAAIGCRDQVIFDVASYLARFGDDGRTVDVTACVGNMCGSLRVERLGANAFASGHSGAAIAVELSSDGRLTVFIRGAAPPDAEQQVQLRISSTSGRQLINYTGRATGQEHCPGGGGCGRCQAILVDLDSADAGQVVDSGDPGHCGS